MIYLNRYVFTGMMLVYLMVGQSLEGDYQSFQVADQLSHSRTGQGSVSEGEALGVFGFPIF